jgi:hypothetical protein
MRPLLAGWLVLTLTSNPAPGAASADTEPITLSGKVVELTEALKPLGLPVDTEVIAHQVVVQGEDGSITPLLSDEASRALFQDERLRNRRTEVKARLYPGLPYVQVLSFRVEEGGKLRTPEYYCVVCTISVRYPQTCPCCQGEMELRMKPESP